MTDLSLAENQDDATEAAHILSCARRDRKKITALPSALSPQTREAAYAIQDALIALEGGEIGGWKIGAGTGPKPFCSPLPAKIFASSGSVINLEATMTRLIEVEVAVVLAHDLPSRAARYSEEDIRAAIASFQPVLEIIASRFIDPAAVPKLDSIADMLSNIGVVSGAGQSEWQALALEALPIKLSIGGAEVGATDKGVSTDAVIEALTWLANHAAVRTGGLRAGQVIITGARVIAPTGKPGDIVEAEVSGLGKVSCVLS